MKKNKMKKWHKPIIQRLSLLETRGGTKKKKAESWKSGSGTLS